MFQKWEMISWGKNRDLVLICKLGLLIIFGSNLVGFNGEQGFDLPLGCQIKVINNRQQYIGI